jgi:hypothetical protein
VIRLGGGVYIAAEIKENRKKEKNKTGDALSSL